MEVEVDAATPQHPPVEGTLSESMGLEEPNKPERSTQG